MVVDQQFLPYSRQSITDAEITEVVDALKGAIITRGPIVEKFEQAMCEYTGARYAVAFNSGTAALQASCYAAGVGPADRLVTSPNTFVATIGGGIQLKATPVFVDIDPTTGNVDVEQMVAAIGQPMSRGRPVLLPVHFAGLPVDMARLDSLIKNPDTIVIEDAAHALGSNYVDGQRVGSCAYSSLTVFSFHPAKLITTGEGGMVMTNDSAMEQRLRRFRNNGIERDNARLINVQEGPWYYEVHDITGNFNLTDFQAALGLSQLRRLDSLVARRQQVLGWYRQRLKGIEKVKLLSEQVSDHVAGIFCIALIDFIGCKVSRADVMRRLLEEGIGTHVHYIPLYRHPYFEKLFPEPAERFPNMEQYYAKTLSLPLYCDMTEEDVERVVNTLLRILGQRAGSIA